MSLQLQSITFNHDPTSAQNDAVNIRHNASTFSPVPEWQRGISTSSADSVAAYALQETLGNRLTIRVELTRTNPRLTAATVRAVPISSPSPTPPPPVWWPYWPIPYYPPYYYWTYYGPYTLWPVVSYTAAAASPPSSVLGSVKSRQVQFQAGQESIELLFELQNPRLWTRGVGTHPVTWLWQYRLGGTLLWQNFALTRHKIYTILTLPTDPWQQAPFNLSNTQLPWTEVLDVACDWAYGAKTLDEAAARITRAVYDLGDSSLRYGCELGGFTQYTDLFYPYFYCSEFLEYLNGGIGRGGLINCTDCATIVSTFANILGCDLWQARMGADFPVFATNPIRAIGYDKWGSACGFAGFSMHEVAWKGACSVDDELFDACLELDGGSDPTRPPHVPRLPLNMRFGKPGDGHYRDRLAAPHDNARELCAPQQGSRRRRFVL